MTLPTKFNPQPNHFYVSGTISKDLMIRSKFGDTYDGATTSGTIDTGVHQKFYIAQSNAPDYNARYEDSDWSTLHLASYANDITQTRNFFTPQYKVYAMNPNTDITEGSLDVVDENLTVFTSRFTDDNAFITEQFSGKNKGFQDREDYSKGVVSATTVASTDFRYTITGDQIWEGLSSAGQFKYPGGDWSSKSFAKRALTGGGRGSWTYNILEGNGGKYYIQGSTREDAEKSSTLPSGKFTEGWVNVVKYLDMVGERSINTYIAWGATAQEALNIYQNQYNVVDTEFVDRVTQFNSIFNYVREAPDAEDIKVQTVGSGGDDTKFFTYSKVGLDAGDKLTGGASASFINFWENWSGTVGSTPYSSMYGVAASGGILPQTCMASIDYLPQVLQLDIGGSGNTAHVNYDGTGFNDPVVSPEISIDMKFENMAPVLNTYQVPGLGNVRLERGFSIIFAESFPQVNEGYMDYITRLRDNNEICTGLFFYAPRDSPAERVYGIPFMNMISGAATPTSNGPGAQEAGGSQFSLMYSERDPGRYFTSGNSNNPGVYSMNGNNNYFDFPLNEWLNLTFKFGAVNNFEMFSGSSATSVYRKQTSKDWVMAYSNNTTKDGAMQTVKLQLGDSHFGPNSSGTALMLNAVSFWNNNVRANKDTTASENVTFNNTSYDAAGFRDKDMFSTVKLDNISMRYYNLNVYNSTVCDNNTIQNSIQIPSPADVVPSPMVQAQQTQWPADFGISGSTGFADNYFGQKSSYTHSNISIGFDTIPNLDQTDGGYSGSLGFLMNDFGTADPSNIRGVASKYVTGSYSKRLGHQMHGMGVDAMAYFFNSGTFNQDDEGYNRDVAGITCSSSGDMSVDDFTQKGFIFATGLANISGTWAKRENIYCAARITGSNDDGTIIEVDNPAIFDLPLGPGSDGGTDFLMWKNQYATDAYAGTTLSPNWTCGVSGTVSQGGGPTGSNGVFQIKKREGNTIYLNRPTRAADYDGFNTNTMVTSNKAGLGSGSFKNYAQAVANKRQLGNVWISPIKYWLNLHIANVTEQPAFGGVEVINTWGGWYNPSTANGSGTRVQAKNAPRSYGATLATSGLASGTTGSTWNEWLYTDGQYEKMWDLTNAGGDIIETDTDYGYGVYIDDDNGIKFDGYIQNVYPIENSYTYADLSTYISTKSPSWGDPFNYSLYPYFEQSSITSNYTINLDTKEGTNVPYLIWGYLDTPPILTNLSVVKNTEILDVENAFEITPNQLNTVKLSWDEEDSEDIWYRFLIVDNKPIYDKYHGASLYTHLNSSSANTQAVYYNGSFINQYQNVYTKRNWYNSGTMGVTFEGFEGYGTNFTEGTLDLGALPLTLTVDTNKFSFLAHCVPQSISGTIFEAVTASGSGGASGTTFQIAFSSNRVVANVYEQPGGGELNPNITSSTHLTGSTFFSCDGSEDVAIALTYDGELDAGNWKLYINGALEDSQTYVNTTAGAGGFGRSIRISGYPTIGGRRLPTSGAKTGSWDNFTGLIEEVTTWNGITLYFPSKNEFILDTSTFLDYGMASGSYIIESDKANAMNARVFAVDKHNIRGRNAKEMGMSNQAGWRVTGL